MELTNNVSDNLSNKTTHTITDNTSDPQANGRRDKNASLLNCFLDQHLVLNVDDQLKNVLNQGFVMVEDIFKQNHAVPAENTETAVKEANDILHAISKDKLDTAEMKRVLDAVYKIRDENGDYPDARALEKALSKLTGQDVHVSRDHITFESREDGCDTYTTFVKFKTNGTASEFQTGGFSGAGTPEKQISIKEAHERIFGKK